MTSSADRVTVSVVMIFHNAERYFREAIDSVLSQTHPTLELLLCDDGSGDSSTAIAGELAQFSDRVRHLQHPGHGHRGMSSTRNLGLAAARGELVAFLDADDVWEPGHLEHEVGLLLAHPEAGLVCGRAVEWYSWADPEARDEPSPLPWPAGVVVPPPQMLSAVLRRGAFRTPVCSLLVRTDVLRSVGGSEEKFAGLFEDQALLAKLLLSQRVVISEGVTARYRRHQESSTAVAAREGTYHPTRPNRGMEAFLDWLSTLPQLHATPDNEEVATLVAAALSPYRSRPSLRRLPSSWVRRAVPASGRQLARRVLRRARSFGPVRMGSLRRTQPLSSQFGYDRGLPVDRHYIEHFLAENAQVIAGAVLEVGDGGYTRRFGGSRVRKSDVLNIGPGHPETTIVADLADGSGIASDQFDCLVITQTLHLVYELRDAVRTLHRILRPGGTLLATFPGISPISSDVWADSWHWALTPLSAARLFGDEFGVDNIEVRAHGNVLTSVAFLEGMAAGELRPAELDHHDPQYPMLITVRAQRPVAAVSVRRA